MSNELLNENKQLMREYYQLERELYQIRQKQRDIQSKVEANKVILMTSCDHDWEYEPPVYQERSWRTCTICDNRK